jgi:hypothetical protein
MDYEAAPIIPLLRAPSFPVSSRRDMWLLVIWLFAWPLALFVYNPLTKPYEPLTLLLVVPGGAIWLLSFFLSFFFLYETLFYLAAALWPPAMNIKKAINLLARTLLYIFVG